MKSILPQQGKLTTEIYFWYTKCSKLQSLFPSMLCDKSRVICFMQSVAGKQQRIRNRCCSTAWIVSSSQAAQGPARAPEPRPHHECFQVGLFSRCGFPVALFSEALSMEPTDLEVYTCTHSLAATATPQTLPHRRFFCLLPPDMCIIINLTRCSSIVFTENTLTN